MSGRRPGLARAAAMLLIIVSTTPTRAEQYPAQNIKMVVPFGPGGAGDLVARPLAQELSTILGQAVFIENRPGANGVIGTNAVAKAAPDGYTMLLTTGGFSANPSIIPNLPYDAIKDFAPVSQLAISYGLMLMVRPDHPAKSAAELAELARRDPNKLTYAMLGPGNNTHVTMELFKKAAGVQMIGVPYKSSAENTNAVLSGQVDVAPLSTNSAVPYLAGKQLRALGLAGYQRVPALPDVPTLVEQGFPRVVNQGYFGIWVPAGTPRERVDLLYNATKRALESPTMRRFIADSGYSAVGSTPDEFAAFIVKDVAEQRETLEWIGVIPKRPQ